MENYNLHRRAQSGWHPTSYSRKPTPDAPRERNYEAILAAAKRPPVGYYEDAPRGIQFGGGAKPTGPLAISSREGQPSAAPSSPAWPAYTLYFDSLSVWSAEGERKIYWKNGEVEPGRPHDGFKGNCGSRITQAQFIAKLRGWNHPALKEFEAPSATGARAWKSRFGYHWLSIGVKWFAASPIIGWTPFPDNWLAGSAMTGWVEQSPAEVQRLVGEAMAAMKGK